VHVAIERAVRTARQDPDGNTMVAVLGGEGSGKSWSVAKWWLEVQPRPILLLSAGRMADHLSPAARLIGTPRKRTISAGEVGHGRSNEPG
jgi:hypothetical protein